MPLEHKVGEPVLGFLLKFVVALPGLLGGICLGLSFAFAPSAIARGEHLDSLGFELLPCAGCSMCGMSRAFAAMAHGQWLEAFAFNPGVTLLWPTFWVAIAVSAWGLYRLWRAPPRFFAEQTTPEHP